MNKRRKALYVYISVFIFGMIGFSSLFYFLLLKNSAIITEATVTIVDKEIESEFPGLHLQTVSEENSLYTISMSIPKHENENLNDLFEKWVDQEKQSFMKTMENEKHTLTENNMAHLNIKFETVKVNENLYSIVLTADQYIGDKQKQTNVQPFMFDINDGKTMGLEDIFNVDDSFTTEVTEAIQQSIAQDEVLKGEINESKLNDKLTDVNELKIALKEKSLHVYFDQHEIASSQYGHVDIEVPLNKLEQYLKENITLLVKKEQDKKAAKEKPKKKKKEKSKSKKDKKQKYIALTFDDGPSPEITPRVLNTLHEYDVKATFFMLGSRVDYYPSIAKQVADEGHEIANHSLWHPDLTKLSYKQIEKQFEETTEKLENATGYTPTLIRPPYGAFNKNVEAFAEKGEYAIVLWTVDSLDWKAPNKQFVYQRVIDGVTDGSIILMHDIHEVTADALPEIMETLVKEGYQFVTVSELLELLEEKGPGPIYGKM